MNLLTRLFQFGMRKETPDVEDAHERAELDEARTRVAELERRVEHRDVWRSPAPVHIAGRRWP